MYLVIYILPMYRMNDSKCERFELISSSDSLFFSKLLPACVKQFFFFFYLKHFANLCKAKFFFF